MKRNQLAFILGGMLALSSCSKDTLVLPESMADNTPKEAIDVIVKPTDVQVVGSFDRRFIFRWPIMNDKIEHVKITYQDGDEEIEHIVSDFSEDFIITTSFLGQGEFTLQAVASDGRTTDRVVKRATNQDIYTQYLVDHLQIVPRGAEWDVRWSNELKSNLQVRVTYTTTEGTQTEILETEEETDHLAFYALDGDTFTVEVEDDLGRTASRSYNYEVRTEDLTSAAQKTGWSATVSSQHPGDGIGGPGLIDGNPETYWHTPWGGEIPAWPHIATITMNNEKLVTAIILANRHNNGSGAPKNFDVEVSTDGEHYEHHQSFVNSSTTAGEVIVFPFNEAVSTRYLRIVFRSDINGNPYMALGEISFQATSITLVD
ncbi:MAG TPA: discoidin domain-containing protein [Sphingobacterium sp.]|nr:discoidin domain-containing protein [Sphingobacterium sp.]